jgi:hypothetical protein
LQLKEYLVSDANVAAFFVPDGRRHVSLRHLELRSLDHHGATTASGELLLSDADRVIAPTGMASNRHNIPTFRAIYNDTTVTIRR